MPSSKFNQRPVPKQRPAICIAPAGSCLPPYDLAAPETLTATIVAVSLNDPTPYDWRAMATTDPRETWPAYALTLRFPDGILHLRAEQQLDPNLWNVTFDCHPDGGAPKLLFWTDLPIDPAAPFDTGLLTKMYVPGINYYRARLTA